MKLALNYLSTLLIMIGLDTIWLGVIAKDFNQKHLKFFLRPKFLLLPALFFYLIYAAGLMYFVIKPALIHQNLLKLILSGAFLGLIAYATFELTSYAAFKDWSIKLVLVDILWGAFMSGLTALIVFKLHSS